MTRIWPTHDGDARLCGIEATVRSGGHVLPKNVEDDLPRLHEALQKRGLEITIMATDINAAINPALNWSCAPPPNWEFAATGCSGTAMT